MRRTVYVQEATLRKLNLLINLLDFCAENLKTNGIAMVTFFSVRVLAVCASLVDYGGYLAAFSTSNEY